MTDYRAKHFSHEPTGRHPPDCVEKLTGGLMGAFISYLAAYGLERK